ncbi:hypothetical protein G9A89_004711 [Geosiphon pyriformis]|nr:hypothetical protein G9A89_004711 [Geosiphon pyriformis]
MSKKRCSKKKVILGNVKYSGNKQNISLKFDSGNSAFSDVESLSGDENDVNMSGGSNGSLLNSAVNTPRANRLSTGMDFGSPFSFPNFTIDEEVKPFPSPIKKINFFIIKTQVEVPVKKSFALNINLLAVEDKSATAKTQLIRKIFSKINDFGGATTLSKFEGIIRSTFTSKESMRKAASLAKKKGIIVNNNMKKQELCLDWAVVIKEILMNMPKDMIIAIVSEFGIIKSIKIQLVGMWQKTVVKFADSDQAIVIPNWERFSSSSRDWFRVLLFTLPVDTTAHDLGTLLNGAGGKTCVINRSLEIGNWFHCAVVCFEFDEMLESVFHTEPIFGGVRLSWARLELVRCGRCGHFGHSALECDAFDSSPSVPSNLMKRPFFGVSCLQLAKLYARKNVSISRPAAFDMVSFASPSGSGLLSDVSVILRKLSSFELVPLASPFCASPLAVSVYLASVVASDMALDGVLASSILFLFDGGDSAAVFSSSGSKVLISKLGGLEFKMSGLEASFSLILLKDKIYPWLVNKFDGVRVFFSGLNSGYVGAGVVVIMNNSLAKHVISVLGFYTGASSTTQFSQVGEVNFLIAIAVNESFFVILGGDFNEDGSHKCASFKRCFDLGLVNSLNGSSFVKVPTWCNSHSVAKMIDYVFVSSNLIGALVNCGVVGVEEFFDTDYKAISDCWKYDVKGADEIKWSDFRITMADNASMFLDEFVTAKQFSDLDAILHKLELLMSKLMKSSHLVSGGNFASLLDTWDRLDSVGVLLVKSLFLSGSGFDAICFKLSKTRKSYHSSKLMESKCAKEFHIRQAVERRMENFEVNKSHTIRSVLECPFRRVVLDHLVVGEELVLKPKLVKSKVDVIMEGWTWKHVVVSDISDIWEMFGVVSNLPDEKAAGLSGIANELWKYCDKLVLHMLLVLLNFCLICESEGVLTNTQSIVLIETAHKILSKILSDWISLACSSFNVLYGDNFSVLKGTTTQLPIFAIGSVVKDALEKNQELWLVLVMTDFGLTNSYCVHDGLDQEKVFLPLLWSIFYDLLLCEIRRQKSVCSYHLISHFVSKTGHVESQSKLTLFLTAGAFVDDTIWVGSSQVATQYILNIASEFFRFNDILINNDKTVAISINCRIVNPVLTIIGLPIFIAKKREPHHYLDIFLSSEGLSRPSLAKAHSDIRFFVNLILKKTISDKQFAYLVSSVLFLIIGYRTQFSFVPVSVFNKWDALIHKGLKSKSGLLLDFPNDALHHLSLYNLKTFEQVQAESKLASVVAFANSAGVLGHLFSHRSHDLQVLSWHPHHPLLFPAHVSISPSNNFLADVVCIFSGCDLSLSGSLADAFRLRGGIPMSRVLGKKIFFKCVSSLKHYSIAFVEQFHD